MKPNALAWVALYAWPAVALLGFALRRSSRVARTTAWMMILPVMFLPANITVPFAAINKQRIAVLSLAAALALFHRRELALRDRWRHLPLLLLAAFGIGSLVTVSDNARPLRFGPLRLPGLGIRDAAWITWGYFVDLFLPFVIGQRVFRTERDLRDLLEVLSTCALIYVPLCLIELRMSPQLSNWVYGYFPHSFIQQVRGSGYRPVVFMNHGLSVAMFTFSGLCASLALRRARTWVQPRPGTRALVVGALLLACKSLASILYGLVALVMHAWSAARLRTATVALLGTVVIAYPVLRVTGVAPVAAIGDAFRSLSAERADSLMYRFKNEDRLLARAMERPAFGWGNWGRSRVYVSWGEFGEAGAGYNDISVTDGAWIIWLGTSGILGFVLTVSLVTAPLFRYVRNRAAIPPSSRELMGGFALMIGLFAVDLLPNSQSDFLPAAYGGALFTLSAVRARSRARSAPPAVVAAAERERQADGD